MTTTVCAECNSEIPDDNDLCPECGFPLVELPGGSTVSALEPAATPELATLLEAAAALPPEPVAEEAAATPPAQSGYQQEMIVLKRINAGEDLTNQVLQAQIESLNSLNSAVGQLIDNSNATAINQLVVSLGNFVNSAENTNNDMLSDLITNIGRFVDSSEKIKDDMLNGLKEQNLTTISSMQEVVTSFSGEVSAAADGMKEAQKNAVAEMNGIAQQVQAAMSKKPPRISSENSYVLYMCAILLFFTLSNFLVAVYLVRLVK